jgi:magnesium chelatase family protein
LDLDNRSKNLREKNKYKRVFIPEENVNEVNFIEGIEIYGLSTLLDAAGYLNGELVLEKADFIENAKKTKSFYEMDFNEVKGQKLAKRAIEVAASGGHNIIMIGPPGGGKTMLSQRIPTILPDLQYNEAVDVTRIYSVAGLLKEKCKIIFETPFRNPHHSSSTVSLIGGGSNPVPGEVSLAHNGVLFLDELPEFRRDALEALRQPMEDGRVCISRVKNKCTYPSRFMLVASMNPCPCGYFGYQLKQCKCTEMQIRTYLNKVSGPLLDRIDIHITVEPVQFEEINNNIIEESSESIRSRVEKARKVQQERFNGETIQSNSQMKTKHLKKYCVLDSKGEALLKIAFKSMALSTRAYSKVLKISRTIADMDESVNIQEKHIAEALQYRILDRKYWG